MTKKQKQAADLFAKSTMNAKKKSAGDFGFPSTVTKPKRARLKRIAVPSDQSAGNGYWRIANGNWRTSLSLQRLIQNAVPNRLVTPVDAKEIVHVNRPTWTEAATEHLLGRCPVDIAEARLWEGLARDYFAKYSTPLRTMGVIIAEMAEPLKLDEPTMRSLVLAGRPDWNNETIKSFLNTPSDSLDEIVIWQKHARQYVAKMKPEDFYQDAPRTKPRPWSEIVNRKPRNMLPSRGKKITEMAPRPLSAEEVERIVRYYHPTWSDEVVTKFLSSPMLVSEVQWWHDRVTAFDFGPRLLGNTAAEVGSRTDQKSPFDKAVLSACDEMKEGKWQRRETQGQQDSKEDEARKRRKMGILDAGFLYDQTTGLLKEWENLSTALCEDSFVYGYAVATEMISIRVAFSRLFSLLAERSLITIKKEN